MNTYALRQIDGGKHHVREAEDGTVYIETSSDALSIHEITHVRQALNAGGLRFNDGMLLNPGNTVGRKAAADMEVEAYKMQYSYQPSSFSSVTNLGDINYRSVWNVKDENGRIIYGYMHGLIQQEKIRNKTLKKRIR